jgi:hypothetical protein
MFEAEQSRRMISVLDVVMQNAKRNRFDLLFCFEPAMCSLILSAKQ